MSVNDFKAYTYVGVLARRKEQVAAIDLLLAQFHNTALEEVGKRMKLLRAILEQVHDHLRNKPTSSRSQGVLVLGEQVIATIYEYLDKYLVFASWLPRD